MIRRPPRSTRTDTLFPYTTLFRSRQNIIELLLQWIDRDRKSTALKALQGMIWKDGYEAGDYRAHLYPEVAARLRGWRADGLRLYVYSSGSVPAQKLFFRYSEAGDLGALFTGYFHRPEERSVGKEGVRTCRTGGS